MARGRMKFNADFFANENNKPGSVDKLIQQARKSGSLNLSNRDLTSIPSCVWRMNTEIVRQEAPVAFNQQDGAWWEQVDLTKLIVTYNKLTELSSEIKLVPTLITLDLQGNQLQTLPDAIGEVEALKVLIINSNKIRQLPRSMGQLHNLVQLSLKENLLEQFPECITQLTCLEHLDVSQNKLQTLPQSLDKLLSLRKFTLKSNMLNDIPQSIAQLTNLYNLDLSANRLVTFPAIFSSNSSLEILDLRQNRLEKFPVIENVQNIKEVYLSSNSISEIPIDRLRPLNQVLVLDLASNKVNCVPVEIKDLDKLTRLDLSRNNIANIPCEIGFMENLHLLSLEGNPMRSLARELVKGTEEVKKLLRTRYQPSAAEQISAAGEGSNLVRAAGQNTGMVGVDSGLVDRHHVATCGQLQLTNKKLTSIPIEVWQALEGVSIREINFEKNKLTELPTNVLDMAHCLQFLNLSCNEITSLPENISQLSKLRSLNVSSNRLKDLPSSLATMVALETLNVSNNPGFSPHLPPVVYSITSLHDLFVGSCHITSIDASKMRQLTALSTLDLSCNDIVSLPPELGLCETIKILKVEGNAFRVPRISIIEKGTVAILEYLRDKIPR